MRKLDSARKRTGEIVPFDASKIKKAIEKAFHATGELDTVSSKNSERILCQLAKDVLAALTSIECEDSAAPPSVEEIQDAVEQALIKANYAKTAKAYILYRQNHAQVRSILGGDFAKTLDAIIHSPSKDVDKKRENANIDGDTPMGMMLRGGSEAMKAFVPTMISEEHANAHKNGDIHIHDMDFLPLTTTCCQIDIEKLFENGFNTGHGYLREPKSIRSFSSLTAIAIQANQNDQHGGQSVPNLDYALAKGVKLTYKRAFLDCLTTLLVDYLDFQHSRFYREDITEIDIEIRKQLKTALNHAEVETGQTLSFEMSNDIQSALIQALIQEAEKRVNSIHPEERYFFPKKLLDTAQKRAYKLTNDETHQQMEALIGNLNTMHSRAGAQVPFSSLNYGTDTSPEGRMVIHNLLQATEEGLGHGEIPIFPIQIFKVKEGVNFNKGDANYDLFQLACRVSAKRMFPNFSFLDAPFNKKYYKEGHPETECAYMGCRTRVMSNVFKDKEIVYGRGNLSFTSINLPRIAIESNGDEKVFYARLQAMLKLAANQLLERFAIQCKKTVRNFPFLMGEGIWLDSDTLDTNDSLKDVLKHGTLTIGFIGLAETLVSLYGKHHGESEDAQKKGLNIISFMRDFCDKKTEEMQLNFSLIASPAEGLSGRFVKMDRQRYGCLEGITDREYYTNSFHVPVYYEISAFEKLRIEAPYHELTNGGHISYIEMDGDPMKNLIAFEEVIRYMKEIGIGYGSINHPVDRDPVCGYTGIIGDICPRCGRREGEAVSVEKLRKLGVRCACAKTNVNPYLTEK